MSYASSIGVCNEVAIDSDIIVECVGVVAAATVELGIGEGLGDDGALAFCGGIIAVGGGVIISTFSFSEGSVVRSGKCGIFCSFTWEKAAPVMSLPLTRRSRLPELAT